MHGGLRNIRLPLFQGEWWMLWLRGPWAVGRGHQTRVVDGRLKVSCSRLTTSGLTNGYGFRLTTVKDREATHPRDYALVRSTY